MMQKRMIWTYERQRSNRARKAIGVTILVVVLGAMLIGLLLAFNAARHSSSVGASVKTQPSPVETSARVQLSAVVTPATGFSSPAVAIHVSELTKNLETMPAVPPTPMGSGTSGFQWWITAWHYFTVYESIEEALRSDGTPFIEVSDADIRVGRLLTAEGSPKYPILISLASEAISDDEISQLRSYVTAGGFLFAGSSAFTRNPDGTTRGNFALADEMGLQMAKSDLQNWYLNDTFSKALDHRLVSHIPWGLLAWHMPQRSETMSQGTDAYNVWQVRAIDAEVIANGGSGPILATKAYGEGRFIYHGAMQPVIGYGAADPSTYAYVIYRNAIEWAFESAKLPLIRLSPWRYPYDAALVFRHDFENSAPYIQAIEYSAKYESSVGVRGDYFFCTGVVRLGSEDHQLSEEQKMATITSLGRAVSLYGATIGSHNGGLSNPAQPSLPPQSYQYWHWGPDQALDLHPQGYINGKAYAYTSILISFQDIEGWLSGLDNGRSGCGTARNCPRLWAAPYYSSTREASKDLLEQLGVATSGEQEIGPFPHWTLSTETPDRHYSHLTLPVSNWYTGTQIAQSMEQHDVLSLRSVIDFYYGLGALVNIYAHNRSDSVLGQAYIAYSFSKPRTWSTNATGIYDWWQLRSTTSITPSYSLQDGTTTARVRVAGSRDPDTAIQIAIPGWPADTTHNVRVLLNEMPATQNDYRTTSVGVEVRVGTTASTVDVSYGPLLKTMFPLIIKTQ
ncbi:MAG: hypothetical protein NT169_20940 [Chloroflexi bacterium]|nr:hypothetical protein [Chloroflexota bacterium]